MDLKSAGDILNSPTFKLAEVLKSFSGKKSSAGRRKRKIPISLELLEKYEKLAKEHRVTPTFHAGITSSGRFVLKCGTVSKLRETIMKHEDKKRGAVIDI